MGLLNRPSRSYKDIEHNAEGLSAAGSAPYAVASRSGAQRSAPPAEQIHTVKTYRPSYAELHFKRQAMHDQHPSSSFSPLPPAFQLGRKNKEQARAGQKAELEHILEPGYKSSIYGDDDTNSVAGPSRLSSVRTAGGLSALSRKKDKERDDNVRSSGSVANLRADAASSRRGGALGGVYLDSNGRLHDTEYDPFAAVSKVSRRKSQRRSAFGGGAGRRASIESGSSDGSSDSGGPDLRRSFDGREVPDEMDREQREIHRRLVQERRQLDEVSGMVAARRRSIMSDRASGFMSGRATPSIRSGGEDTYSLAPARTHSRLSQHQLPSSLSPTFDRERTTSKAGSTMSGSSYNTRHSARGTSSTGPDESPRKHTETTPEGLHSPDIRARQSSRLPETGGEEDDDDDDDDEYADTFPTAHSGDEVYESDEFADPELEPSPRGPEPGPPPYDGGEDTPRASVQTPTLAKTPSIVVKGATPRDSLSGPNGIARPKSKPASKSRIERAPSGATRITGFDAGPPRPPPVVAHSLASSRIRAESVLSGGSSRSSDGHGSRRAKPMERPREQSFPETPAQAKRREERERRHLRAGKTTSGGLAYDTAPAQVAASSRSRILPDIEIVADDDPRIIFPPNGPSTRIQSHDHVIRTTSGASASKYGVSRGPTSISGAVPSTAKTRDSLSLTSGSAAGTGGYHDSTHTTSAIIEETGGGYVPSRWAKGDRSLRVTTQDKDLYRPREWGGKHGNLGGREEEWRPEVRDQFKRNMKDLSTNARFSVFRAKKKILRKAEL